MFYEWDVASSTFPFATPEIETKHRGIYRFFSWGAEEQLDVSVKQD